MKGSKLYDKALRRVKAPEAVEATPNELLGAINRTFATPDGKRVLKYLGEICHWYETTVCLHPTAAELNPLATAYIATKQDVYRELRGLIQNDILKEVEFFNESHSNQKGGTE